MSDRVDKVSMPCNKPKRTPEHPEKSHVVKACYSGKEKIIHFGEQGASTAGKPKAGESERMKMKRKSFKVRHAKNIAKGPESAAYWANKVKWADGGAVNLKEGGALNRVRKQREPEPSFWDYAKSVGSTLTSLPSVPGALWDIGERAVKATPQAVRSGLQYVRSHTPREVGGDIVRTAKGIGSYVKEHPVSTALDVIPIVGDIKAYGEDVRDAARRRALGDLAGAYKIEQMALPLAIASIAPGVGEARKAAKVADVVDTAVDTARAGTRTMKRAASFPVDYGRPKGNLNLRPNIDPVTLKGAEVQDIDSLINQLRGRPGVTKEGLEQVAKQFQPGEKISLARFGERMPRSEYGLVDLSDSHVGDDLYDVAVEQIAEDPTDVWDYIAESMGLSPEKGFDLRLIHDGGVDSADPKVVEKLIKLRPDEDPESFLQDHYNDVFANFVSDRVSRMRDDPLAYGLGSHRFQGEQRLVADEFQPGYFEFGVTHPEVGDLDFESVDYRGGHYPSTENLIGHIRGTFNPESLMRGDVSRYDFTPKLNSMVIEELQSDPVKVFGQVGPLHQVHGTLFKGAVQKALEGGADTIYLPTAKSIALARKADPSAYSSIYDKEVIKYGLNPLQEIPGVSVTPIDDVYHEITISPEARERILKGSGQKAPGYAEGGLVSSYDEAKVKDLADQIREGIYG